MRILFVSAYFPPEIGAPARRVHELSRRWTAQGHTVQVLTGFPNHPTGVIPPGYRGRWARGIAWEELDEIHVVRCWLVPTPNRRSWQRMINYSSFFLSASLTGPWLKKPNLVLATSPHLLVGLAGWWISRWMRVPFCLEIRDLWPESLIASGVGQRDSWLIRLVKRLAGFLYRNADRIITVTQAMAQVLHREWKVPQDRLAVVEHGVDPDRFKPMPASEWPEGLRNLNGHRVISYIGTMGLAHGLSTLLAAARLVAVRDPQILFLLIGEGADKSRLMAQARALELKNLLFLPQQPPQDIPSFINRSAFCVATLKPSPTFEVTLPTKILEALACGKPMVLAAAGHSRRILEESKAGLAVDPDDPQGLAEAILTLARDPELRLRCGEQGRRYVLQRFSIDQQAARYLDQLNRLVISCHAPTS